MAIRNLNAAESWEKVYQAFSEVNFTAYDYDTIKESLLQYVKLYYKETFNDFIESSEFIAMLEMFAYIAEQLAYRIDMMAHENFITTAQRKQSILRLARLISYKASRNIPGRGLVKVSSVSTSEQIFDSLGNNLSNRVIVWNDPNNTLWKEQFFLVMNRILTNNFGQPSKSYQVNDVAMQLYTLNNDPTSFTNGVYSFNVNTGIETFQMEVVQTDIDENGPFEKTPDINSQMPIIYANDGVGDGSDYSGFLFYIKQGSLIRVEYSFDDPIPNRSIELNISNVNQTDVWLNSVDENGNILEIWNEVETVNEQNLVYNQNKNRTKFEIETLENDRIKISFGDGDFSDIPLGTFYIWVRQSANRSIVIQKNKLTAQPINFTYTSKTGTQETCAMTFGLTSTIQNSAASETLEHIRQSAPLTYYSQNRMVNAQDYNSYMLKDSSILRLKAINRTFAGQSKYIEWNDASGNYENIKLFGDDLSISYQPKINSISTSETTRGLIDQVLEPLLAESGIFNLITHTAATSDELYGVISIPRIKFIEDASLGVGTPDHGKGQEKTRIQRILDQHYYGEPLEYVEIDGVIFAKIADPSLNPKLDDKIYSETVPRTIDGVNPYISGDIGSGLNNNASWGDPPSGSEFGLKFIRTSPVLASTATLAISTATFIPPAAPIPSVTAAPYEVWTLEVADDSTTVTVTSNLRGKFPSAMIGVPYNSASAGQSVPLEFTFNATEAGPGDAFIVRIDYSSVSGSFSFQTPALINLTGRWEIINSTGSLSSDVTREIYYDPEVNELSWLIWVRPIKNSLGEIEGFTIYTRDMKLIVESPTTKFWYNTIQRITDFDTKNPVNDKIKILRSNIKKNGQILGDNQNYDVIAPVYDADGKININQLEVLPSDMIITATRTSVAPQNILQFIDLAQDSYLYYQVIDPITWSKTIKIPSSESYGVLTDTVTIDGTAFIFNKGSFIDQTRQVVRELKFAGKNGNGIDFMWQHFTPYGNLIDPSASNIHDIFIITRGYYDNLISYLRGTSTIQPEQPTPLELRNSYGYLLNNKMLSDTIVLHPGKIKLLFGTQASPELRAKFKIVRAPTATFSSERIKQETLSVINDFFSIDNWDFSISFYATELISLIHQRLPTQVASVVLVPLYSTNSFGSLFTVDAGIDEILQSCATINDIEIVEALTPAVLRQKL